MGNVPDFALNRRRGTRSGPIGDSAPARQEMTALPKVTVVMPAHNMELYIERALRSAASQTYPDLDILVIDDGSTDRTAEVAERFARLHANVRVVRTANGGVASARNLGLEPPQDPVAAAAR